MMQKIMISRNLETKILTIEEFAVVEWQPNLKDFSSLTHSDFSLIHKEAYQDEQIKSAISIGKEALISRLRTNSFYPIGAYVGAIADSITDLFQSKKDQRTELFFDDKELLPGFQE